MAGFDLIDDFAVPYLPNGEVERIASAWRKRLNRFFTTTSLDVVELFNEF